jgi:CheY-like chemotaxis protein
MTESTGETSRISSPPVLIVEDDAQLADAWRRALEDLGFRVRWGPAGDPMQRSAWRQTVSMAIIDLRPRLDFAVETAVAVRYRSRKAPILLIGAPSGTGLPRSSDDPGATIHVLETAPDARSLSRMVCALMGIDDDDTRILRPG